MTQLMPISIDGQHGLAYCDDYSAVRSMLKSPDQMDELIERVEASVLGLVADPLTADGRKQIRENGEFASKVAKRLVKIRTEALADLKNEPKKIEEFVRPYVKRLEALAEQAIAPVREIDARAEKLRIMADRPNIITAMDAKGLAVELAQAQAMDVSERIWHEATETAVAVKASLIDSLETMLEARREHEKQVAELEAWKKRQENERCLREIAEAREQGRREEAEARAVAEAQSKAQAVQTVTREICIEKPQNVDTSTDFDSDVSKIERFLMRFPSVPVLRDADNYLRITGIINRAVSAIKGA